MSEPKQEDNKTNKKEDTKAQPETTKSKDTETGEFNWSDSAKVKSATQSEGITPAPSTSAYEGKAAQEEVPDSHSEEVSHQEPSMFSSEGIVDSGSQKQLIVFVVGIIIGALLTSLLI